VSRRQLVTAFVGAVLLLAASVGSALAAILIATLSAEAATPGAKVTLRIDMTGRAAGTEQGVLLLVPVASFREPTRCEQIEGAVALGDMTWRDAQVEFEGSAYPGMASETSFTVPQVSDGRYYLAESWPNQYTRCFTYASFSVNSALPDTATATPRPPLTTVIAGALLGLAVAASHRLRRLR
jgi:hypothetical protein